MANTSVPDDDLSILSTSTVDEAVTRQHHQRLGRAQALIQVFSSAEADQSIPALMALLDVAHALSVMTSSALWDSGVMVRKSLPQLSMYMSPCIDTYCVHEFVYRLAYFCISVYQLFVYIASFYTRRFSPC